MRQITQFLLDDSISMGSIKLEKEELEAMGVTFIDLSYHGYMVGVGEIAGSREFYLLWAKDRESRGCEVRTSISNANLEQNFSDLLNTLQKDPSYISYKRSPKEWDKEIRDKTRTL